jgi:putative nucleotidyltransferase with HDIG domain
MKSRARADTALWINGGSDLPTPAECLRILSAYSVPHRIVRHSQKVALLTRKLAVDLHSVCPRGPNVSLVEAAALLHDIAKASSSAELLDHAVQGGRILRALGMPRVAHLVDLHIDPGFAGSSAKITDAELLAYTDKRVLHQCVVGLDERFDDLFRRYVDLEGQAAAKEAERNMISLEKKIFRLLPYPPESLGAD